MDRKAKAKRKLLREQRLIREHCRFGEETFGVRRWRGANVGWGTTEDSIASKVPGRKTVVLLSSFGPGDAVVHEVQPY